MNKTLELRGIVYGKLNKAESKAYYEIASDNAVYPYKVFTFGNIDLGDLARDDLFLIIDIWGMDVKQVDAIADDVEEEFNASNDPGGNSYPTFFRVSRITVPDENKELKHRQLKLLIQNYYTGE